MNQPSSKNLLSLDFLAPDRTWGWAAQLFVLPHMHLHQQSLWTLSKYLLRELWWAWQSLSKPQFWHGASFNGLDLQHLITQSASDPRCIEWKKIMWGGCGHTGTQAYMHTGIHAYIHTYLPTYLPTYIHTYIHDSALWARFCIQASAPQQWWLSMESSSWPCPAC